MKWLMPRPRIGIAISTDRVVAVSRGGQRFETTDVADLRRALGELKDAVGQVRASVSVALSPPLVELRRLSLPPLRDDERRRVLARDAARYFIGVREPQVIGSDLVPPSTTDPGREPGVYVLAAAASVRLVEQTEAAIESVGWRLAAIVPAHAAWAVQANGQLVAHLPQGTEVLRVEGGRVVERSRLNGDATPPSGAHLVDDPLTVAAAFAPRAHQLELCSEARYARQGRFARKIAMGLGGVAAACVVLAAGLDYRGLGRQLVALRARRAALARPVAAAMRSRDSLTALTARVAALTRLQATAARWSAFLTDLADYLPRDAHLVAVRAAADSAVLEGIARHAGGVFQAVQQIPRVAGVRAEAPIRQDVAPDGTVREQFALGALVRARTTAARPAP